MSLVSLIYHDVEAAAAIARYSIGVARLREHLASLRAALPAAPVIVDGPVDPSGFALTFDDGHKGWLLAAEALEELGWKAIFFVVTGIIGRPGKLEPSDIRRLAAMGHVIGSHTVDHPDLLSWRSDEFIVDQWLRCRAELEDILGSAVTVAAVPGGYYSERVALAAYAAGVSSLFTSEPVARSWNVGGCRVFGRFQIHHSMTGERVARIAAGAPDERARQFISWNVKKAIKAVTLDPYRAIKLSPFHHTQRRPAWL